MIDLTSGRVLPGPLRAPVPCQEAEAFAFPEG